MATAVETPVETVEVPIVESPKPSRFSRGWAKVKSFFSRVWTKVKTVAKTVWSHIKTASSKVWSVTKTAASKVWSFAVKAWRVASRAIWRVALLVATVVANIAIAIWNFLIASGLLVVIAVITIGGFIWALLSDSYAASKQAARNMKGTTKEDAPKAKAGPFAERVKVSDIFDKFDTEVEVVDSPAAEPEVVEPPKAESASEGFVELDSGLNVPTEAHLKLFADQMRLKMVERMHSVKSEFDLDGSPVSRFGKQRGAVYFLDWWVSQTQQSTPEKLTYELITSDEFLGKGVAAMISQLQSNSEPLPKGTPKPRHNEWRTGAEETWRWLKKEADAVSAA